MNSYFSLLFWLCFSLLREIKRNETKVDYTISTLFWNSVEFRAGNSSGTKIKQYAILLLHILSSVHDLAISTRVINFNCTNWQFLNSKKIVMKQVTWLVAKNLVNNTHYQKRNCVLLLLFFVISLLYSILLNKIGDKNRNAIRYLDIFMDTRLFDYSYIDFGKFELLLNWVFVAHVYQKLSYNFIKF